MILLKFPDGGKIIFCDINSNLKDFKNQLQKNQFVFWLDRSDFSEERQLIINNKNVTSITLAKNILRAETAIASTTILNYNETIKSNKFEVFLTKMSQNLIKHAYSLYI